MSAKPKAAPAAADPIDAEVRAGSYEDWTVPELRQRARELGLTGYAKLKKGALVALLRRY